MVGWMIGWHHQLDEFEQVLGDSDGQGSLACSSHGVTMSPYNLVTE